MTVLYCGYQWQLKKVGIVTSSLKRNPRHVARMSEIVCSHVLHHHHHQHLQQQQQWMSAVAEAQDEVDYLLSR